MKTRLLGQYEIIDALGAGGMGEVYKALDARLKREVALKILPERFATDPERLARFQREAEVLASLNHPNIAAIYGLEEADGVKALVLELVEGETLADRLRAGAVPVAEALKIGRLIAEALETAHEKGIIHRDLKPANIKLTPQGTTKVLDFGLAKLTHSSPPHSSEAQTMTADVTSDGAIVGTARYMSPEQARGQPIDKRTDIWSFGCVLYELLTGRPAFPGRTSSDALAAVLGREPDWNLLPAIPAPVRELLRRCLDKEPRRRLRDLGDARLELEAALSASTRAAVAPARASTRWSAGRRGLLAVAALLGVGLLISTALRWQRSSPPAVSPTLQFTPLTNFADSAVSPSLSADGRMLAFIRGANTFAGTGEVYVKILPDGEPVRLTSDASTKMGPAAFSPDGTQVAFTVGLQDSWLVPVLGGEPRRLLSKAAGLTWIEGDSGPRRVLFSKLVASGGLHMGLFTATESRSGERAVYLPTDVNGMVHRAALSPQGDWVLAVEMDLSGWLPCRLVPFDGSSQGRRVGPIPSQCTDVAWSPDGQWMYFAANAGNGFHIWRQAFPDGPPEQVTSGPTEEQGIALDPDGRSLVTSVGESRSTLWIHDPRGDRQVTSQGYAFMPSFTADGGSLYYLLRSQASRRFVSGELWVADVETGRRERRLADFLMEHYSVDEESGRVVFVSNDEEGRSEVWLAKLDNSVAPRRLASFEVVVRALFDSRGGVLFVGGQRGSTFLYRVDENGGEPNRVLPQAIMFLYGVSPDGEAIALWEGGDSQSVHPEGHVVGDGVESAPSSLGNILVHTNDGTRRTLVCTDCATAGGEYRGITPPLVSWSKDGRFVYLYSVSTAQTSAFQLQPGQYLPALPASGLPSLAAAGELPGAQVVVVERAFLGPSPSIYSFPRVTTHRNIFRIPVP